MKYNPNVNHPVKGSITTVDPIRNPDDIKSIAKMLNDNPRDHLLFIMGVNNGLRTGDLLKLKVKQIKHLKPGDILKIREGKTKKINILAVNKTIYKSLVNYLGTIQPDDNDYVFKSKKGDNKPILIQTVNNLVKQWTKAINLKGNYGSHTLRKTWGYIERVKHGAGFDVICRRFNHTNPSVTMKYLGIEDKEVVDLLMNEIGG